MVCDKITQISTFPWGGKHVGDISFGCKACQQGRSTVIFITGQCNAACFYCPVSANRMFKDQAYANETPIDNTEDLIEVAQVLKQQKGYKWLGKG
ncbi:MAG: hypothetical protein ACFFD1_06540, partial [Candidatus Thorarchaeota archaeon]